MFGEDVDDSNARRRTPEFFKVIVIRVRTETLKNFATPSLARLVNGTREEGLIVVFGIVFV